MFEFAWTRHFHAPFPKDVEMMMINLLYPYVQVSREGEFFRYTARPPQAKDQVHCKKCWKNFFVFEIFSKEEFRKSLDDFLYSRPDGVFLYELLNAYEARMETSFPVNGLIQIHGKSGFPMLTSILKTYGVFFMNHPKAHDLMIFSKVNHKWIFTSNSICVYLQFILFVLLQKIFLPGWKQNFFEKPWNHCLNI